MNKKIIPTPREQRTESYWSQLNNIIDPEIGIGLVDLGLIYNVEIKKNIATVIMTLTSTGCPYGASIIEQIKDEMNTVRGVKKTMVKVVWDPIWSPDRINPIVRALLPI